MKIIKIVLKTILILILGLSDLFIILYILLVTPQIIPNNLELKEFRKNLDAVEAPPGALKLAQYGYVGYFSGNGTKCDLVVASLFETNQSFLSVVDFYADKTVVSPDDDYSYSTKIEFGYYDKGSLIFPGDTSWDREDYQKLFMVKLPEYKCSYDKFCFVIYATYANDKTFDYRCR